MKRFRAPWGRALRVVSLLATLFCLGLPMVIWFAQDARSAPSWAQALMFLPALIPAACLPFMVRGYSIDAETIRVRRLWWDTVFPRAELISAEAKPDAMRGSLRTFGNGGFFSFSGWFWSRDLHSYRAFVTDLHRTVILRLEKKTLVLSPDDPEEFARAAMAG